MPTTPGVHQSSSCRFPLGPSVGRSGDCAMPTIPGIPNPRRCQFPWGPSPDRSGVCATPLTLGVPNPQAAGSRRVQALTGPAPAPCPRPLAFPILELSIPVGSEPWQIRRLRHARSIPGGSRPRDAGPRRIPAAPGPAPALHPSAADRGAGPRPGVRDRPRAAPARSACSGCIARVGWCGPSPCTAVLGAGAAATSMVSPPEGADVLAALAGIPAGRHSYGGGSRGTGPSLCEPPAGGEPLSAGGAASLSGPSRSCPARVDGRSTRAGALPGGTELADGASRRRGGD